MKINVIGAGAMGIALSYFLSGRNEVSLIVRKGTRGEFGRIEAIHEGSRRRVNATLTEEPGEADLTIIAVKSYDLQDVLRMDINGDVLFIQNGLSHLKFRKKGMRKFYAVTTLAARTQGRGVSEITGMGYFRVGGEGTLDISFLRESGINAEWVDDIVAELYRKAGINAVINPITSIFRVKNRDVMEDENLMNIAYPAIGELDELFRKMGYDLEIEKSVKETCRVTGENTSSMLQDLNAGRRTEIDAITGELLALGDEMNVRMPANSLLYNAVKFLERNHR
ncbi:MAG: ketopantoate reductase family protein [Thermoplasmata archaeon]